MTKIKNLSGSRPVLFSLLISVAFVVCLRVSGLLADLLPGGVVSSFVKESFDILWPVAISLALGYGFIYRGRGVGATLVPALPSLCLRTYLLVGVAAGAVVDGVQWQPVPMMLAGVLSMVGVGIREEVIFRGIVGNTLALKLATTTKGIWLTVVLSAAMFSGIHIQNLFVGVDPAALVAQLVGAFGLGLVFMAVYLRGGNLWIPILMHAVTDASALFTSVFTQQSVTVVENMGNMNLGGLLTLLPIHVGLTMFLLRKSKRPAIYARLEKLREELQC